MLNTRFGGLRLTLIVRHFSAAETSLQYELCHPEKFDLNVQYKESQYVFYPPKNSKWNDSSPYKVTFSPGRYRIEAWGSYYYGGYSAGTIEFKNKQELYFVIGYQGIYNAALQIGTVRIDVTSGGATDVRLNYSGNWSEDLSIRSRILVAGGSGSCEWGRCYQGSGNGFNGLNGRYYYEDPYYEVVGASQTHGGYRVSTSKFYGTYNGSFGYAILCVGCDMGGVGGGGYYGGASSVVAGPGSGGSGFVSGMEGCNAIVSENDITPSNQSIHYSGLRFMAPTMQQGNTTMPLHTSKDAFGLGNSGQGAVRVTLIPGWKPSCAHDFNNYMSLPIYIFILIYLT